MISGRFENCYGLKEFDMQQISFDRCNKAIIYAPNGVMKSSLAQVFDDIAKGNPTKDRIFRGLTSAYSITHYTSDHRYNSSSTTGITGTDKIYVVKTFSDKFEFSRETVGTLLADEATRHEYNILIDSFSVDIKNIERDLQRLSGIKKSELKTILKHDLHLQDQDDWVDIITAAYDQLRDLEVDDFLSNFKYAEVFNTKTMGIFTNPEFIRHINDYVSNLNNLLEGNALLSNRFDDKHAESLCKSFEKNNLFEGEHSILLKDGVTTIRSIDEWNRLVKEQLDIIYAQPELSTVFTKLKKLLTSNVETSRLRDIIIGNREIIPLFSNLETLKNLIWAYCFKNMEVSLEDYYANVSQYSERLHQLYERAEQQSERWQEVVKEFNQRFKVPFEVKIKNKANFLLKDEAPNLIFEYSRSEGATQRTECIEKDDLMVALSTGEKRAMYLLYILFDLEKIRQQASIGGKYLIIADDIADSFDYKNKYAIIEYLNDLGNNLGIDLLILTHNFDFYRSVKGRLGIVRNNCFICQKNQNGNTIMEVFKYQKDFFKNVIIAGIRDGVFTDDEKKKLLIASIPFYRNVCEYTGSDDYLNLTCYLHLKTDPLDTSSLKVSDLWNIIDNLMVGDDVPYQGNDENYLDCIERIALNCVENHGDEVSLEDKLLLAIAIRLKCESFLKRIITQNTGNCEDATGNQTREWFNVAKSYLTPNQIAIIDEVNIITPESIHINSFMFEPLIDISSWSLKELYQKVSSLL